MKEPGIDSKFEDFEKTHESIKNILRDSKISYIDGIMSLSVLLADIAFTCGYPKDVFLSQFSEVWDITDKLRSDSKS